MPNQRRKGLLAQRRRHDDEGEEDGSAAGDFNDYASTAGSLSTYAEDDGDASHVSNDDLAAKSSRSPKLAKQGPVSKSAQAFRTTADTEAMMNGLKIETADDEVLNFDDASGSNIGQPAASKRPQPARTRSQPTESVKQRSNGQNLRTANSNNRYFLHDDRHSIHGDCCWGRWPWWQGMTPAQMWQIRLHQGCWSACGRIVPNGTAALGTRFTATPLHTSLRPPLPSGPLPAVPSHAW